MLMYSRVAHSGIDFWLDITLALLAAIAMFTMVFELSVGPIESADDPAWMTIMLIYLVFDVVMIVLGILVMQAFVWRPPAGLLLVFLAIIALTLTDWTYTMLVSSGSDTSARWIDLGWPLAAVLGTWAAATDTDQGSRRMEIGRVTTVIPGAAVLAALVVILVAGYRNLDEYIVVIAVVAIVVATVRLIRAIAVASDAATQARLARTDHLTGLANRRMLYEAMDGALADAAVIVLDLDGFKVVNDTLGHEAGDEVLCIVSERFSHHVRRPDMLARLGGDEFAVLLSDSDEVSASQVAERLRDALRAPVVLRGREFQLSASIGIAAGHQDDDVLELMRHADAAMYEAKTTGRDLVRVYRS